MNKNPAGLRKFFTLTLTALIVIISIVFVIRKKSNEWPQRREPFKEQISATENRTPVVSNEKKVRQQQGLKKITDDTLPATQEPTHENEASENSKPAITVKNNNNEVKRTGLDEEKLKTLLKGNKYSEAEQLLKTALEKDAKDIKAKHRLAQIYLDTGRIDESVNLYRDMKADESTGINLPGEPGTILILKNPKEASQYYKKIATGGTIDEKTAKSAIKAMMAYQALRKKNNEKVEKEDLKLSLDLLNDIHNLRLKNKLNSSDIDLFTGGVFMLDDKYKEAGKYYESIGLSEEGSGDTSDKIHAAFARGIIYLSSGKLEEANRFITLANTIEKNSKKSGYQRILPRQEEMIFCEVILFKKGLLFFHLKRMMEQRKKMLENGMMSFENADEIREMLLKMEQFKIDGKDLRALETANETIDLVDKTKGDYFDMALIHPLFKSSLYIYMGDIYKKLEKNTEAEMHYLKAIQTFPPVESVIKDRKKKE